jgi:CelD/BcsL family acetyltransferase involved in cellulose biosynthesis
VRDLSSAEVDAWEELGQNAVEPSPLLEPSCLVPASRFLPNGSGIYLAIAEENGKFYGCLPLEAARRGKDRMPLTLLEHVLRTATTQVRRNRYDLTPLLRSERTDEAMRTLLEAVRDGGIPRAPKLLRLEALCADGGVEAALRSAAQAMRMSLYVAESWARPVTYRRLDGEESPGEEGRRKELKELLRKKRRLGELLGGEVRLVDRSNEPGAIDQLIQLESSGYKSAAGVAMESWEGEPEWFRATCDEFRRRGRLVVCALEAGETTIAMLVMFRAGDRLLGIQRVYDEHLRQFSPGNQLDLLLLDHVHQMPGVRMQDSCTAGSTDVRLFDQSRRVITVIAAVGGRWDRLLLTPFGNLRDRLRLRERLLRLMAEHRSIDRMVRRTAARLETSAG